MVIVPGTGPPGWELRIQLPIYAISSRRRNSFCSVPVAYLDLPRCAMKPWVFFYSKRCRGNGCLRQVVHPGRGKTHWAEGAAAAGGGGRAAPSIRPYYSVPWDDCQRRKGQISTKSAPSGWGFSRQEGPGKGLGRLYNQLGIGYNNLPCANNIEKKERAVYPWKNL